REHLERAERIGGGSSARRGAGCANDRLFDFARGRAIGEAELLDLRALVLDELQREALGAVLAFAIERPVFLRHERRYFLFALADHAQRRALHAPRREAAANF